jgi:hypothetical protein
VTPLRTLNLSVASPVAGVAPVKLSKKGSLAHHYIDNSAGSPADALVALGGAAVVLVTSSSGGRTVSDTVLAAVRLINHLLVLAERVRKIGGTTIRSIGDIARQQRIADNDATFVTPLDMLAELRDDNQRFIASMRATHDLCDEYNDVATTSLLENYIDEAEKRAWFLFESTRVRAE